MGKELLLKPEEVEFYRRTVTSEVEDLMKRVANKNDVFADYQVLLSGSTREDVKVGNIYETDYLIQYDIKVNKIIEVSSYPGYVLVVPNEEDSLRFRSVMENNVLSSNKLIFQFFQIVFDITNGAEYQRKEFYFDIGVLYYNPNGGAFTVNDLNFRKFTNIGASLPLIICTNSSNYDSSFYLNYKNENIDIVLSLRCHAHWPKCAEGWKRYKNVLERECYDPIIEHGVSMVCKVPVKDPKLLENVAGMFRLSFSFAESKLFEFITPEQKEAYKILKILRDRHLPEMRRMNIHEKNLRDRFTSYHLKSVFLTLTIGNYEKRDVRGWLVLLLKEIIVCLQKQSIKHHFIDDLELLANNFFPSREKDCKDLENIFADILKKLPEDLTELRAECLLKHKILSLP